MASVKIVLYRKAAKCTYIDFILQLKVSLYKCNYHFCLKIRHIITNIVSCYDCV